MPRLAKLQYLTLEQSAYAAPITQGALFALK